MLTQNEDITSNERTSVHESITFFDLTRGRADKVTSKLAHYALNVKGAFIEKSIHYKDQQYNYYIQDHLPYEF